MTRLPPRLAVALAALLLALFLVGAPLLSSSRFERLRKGPPSDLPALTLEETLEFNLPRTVVAAVAGAALALAGVVLQAVLRNPLADPYTLGISSGAALGAAAAHKFAAAAAAMTFAGLAGIESSALLGGLASAALVYGIARSRAELPAETLLLAGVAVALLAASGIAVLQFSKDTPDYASFIRWSMGGISGISWRPLLAVLPLLLLGGAAFAFVARDLDVASLDEDSARALGVDPARSRKIAFLGAALVTGGVVAIAGPVGFVGLIVPHGVRRLVGPDHRIVLPCSALAGAAFLIFCDTVARTVLYPTELPINIVTSAIGCPTFIWILTREH
jgi:iron complex transport system permease protein